MQSMVNDTLEVAPAHEHRQVQVRVVNLALYQAAKTLFPTHQYLDPFFGSTRVSFWGTSLQPLPFG